MAKLHRLIDALVAAKKLGYLHYIRDLTFVYQEVTNFSLDHQTQLEDRMNYFRVRGAWVDERQPVLRLAPPRLAKSPYFEFVIDVPEGGRILLRAEGLC